jgi:DNA-binding transcriptional MerR regulator
MLIAELERRSGLSRDTIRYYERQGLISAPLRMQSGYRQYDAHALVELAFVGKAQAIGFTLSQIKPAIQHLRSPPKQCEEVIEGLLAKRSEIEQRIALDKQRLADIKKLLNRLSPA